MPLIHVHMLEGRSTDGIDRTIAKVTEAVASSLNADPQTVRVQVPKTHWGLGGETALRKGR